MPIKPENKSRYPANWPVIRESILVRANHCCENCGVPNHAIGFRLEFGMFIQLSLTGKVADFMEAALPYKVMMIVLTIAHLDHMPENCDPENLRAWCQKCHLNYDHQHHLNNSRETRLIKDDRQAILKFA